MGSGCIIGGTCLPQEGLDGCLPIALDLILDEVNLLQLVVIDDYSVEMSWDTFRPSVNSLDLEVGVGPIDEGGSIASLGLCMRNNQNLFQHI